MTFSASLAYQHALCMDLRHDQLKAAIIHKSSKKIVDVVVFNEFEFSRQGLDAILQNPFFKPDFGDFVLSAGSVRNTLLPIGIFNHTKPMEVFKLNYAEPFENLDYNRLPELDIVNIYELPLWVKSAFVIRFPRTKIFHRTSILLRGIFDQPSFYPKAHLFIEDGHFYLFLTAKSKLTYFNRFDYKNLADIVYQLLFVAEQKEIPQSDLDLNVYGVHPNWREYPEFCTFFKKKPSLSAESEKGEHFILAKQLLCV